MKKRPINLIDRLERKIDCLAGTVSEHSTRLDRIEKVPVIAHELKPQKSKAA